MKFLFILLMFLSLPAFSDVVGTWIYSGSGCRSELLDDKSHRSKAPSAGGVAEATMTFKSDGKVITDSLFEDGERERTVDTYRLKGNQITFSKWSDVEIRLVKNKIIIKDVSVDGADPLCKNGEVFVFILSSLD